MNSVKFIIPVLVLIFALIEETYFYTRTSDTYHKNFKKQFFHQLKTTLEKQQSNIKYLLNLDDIQEIHSNVKALGNDPYLMEAVLINPQGFIDSSLYQIKHIQDYKQYIYQNSTIHNDKLRDYLIQTIESIKQNPQTFIHHYKEDDKLLGIIPIDYGIKKKLDSKSRTGLFLIVKNTKVVHEKMHENIRNEFIPSVIFRFFSLVILIYVLHIYITKRITKLQKQGQLYIDGNKDIDFSVFGNDEIAKLGDTFNTMFAKISTSKYELKQEVYIRTQELENSLSELKEAQKSLIESEKMASLGSLVSGIAHEINTPVGVSLTGVSHINFLTQNVLDNLQDKRLKQSSLQVYLEDVLELSQAMESSLKNAAELIKSLKQIAVDQHTEVKRSFNLCEYVDDILVSLKNTLKKHEITIVNSIPNSLEIESYPGFFSQILNNLIYNSIMHAFEGIQDATIKIDTTLCDNTLILHYSDNGVGMDEHTLKHLFEPFFTTKMGQGGTGLGMYIIYNIVTTKLNGSISCESVPNNGTRFTMSIPLEK